MKNMISLLILTLVGPVLATNDWANFYNNFATDLTPLLALFGEQVTKQFLSESTSVLDNIIFAAAPLGILTAVVSVIRVCGTPSLRAFVGRAQEGHGTAEAELCSSTSHDVCELWNRGGIARVFGRPKILEFIHDKDREDFYRKSDDHTPTAGLHKASTYFLAGANGAQLPKKHREDIEKSVRSPNQTDSNKPVTPKIRSWPSRQVPICH